MAFKCKSVENANLEPRLRCRIKKRENDSEESQNSHSYPSVTGAPATGC